MGMFCTKKKIMFTNRIIKAIERNSDQLLLLRDVIIEKDTFK